MNTYKIKNYCISNNKIGSGAFSTIHTATKIGSNTIYAVKKIDIYKYKDTDKESYKREFSILRKLDHKNIIKLHDIIIDNASHNLFLVLDYHRYGDFSKFLNKRSLKEKFAKKYMFQLRDGLQYLFSKNIIHRDLKPQNILVDDNQNLIITDFGLAKHFKRNEMLETICGSPLYMAPEIMMKKPYTIESDLWSIGVILYQMIYAKLPFYSNSLIGLITEIKKNNIIYSSQYDISDTCTDLISSLLISNPNNRLHWEEFFNHKWFETNELLENQNNLMEISLSNYSYMNRQVTNESQFNSFIYKSIKYKGNGKAKAKSKCEDKKEVSFELNFEDTDELDMDNTDELYLDNSDELYLNNTDVANSNEISKTISLPINIKNTYIVVNKNIKLPRSEPKEPSSASDSFKEYLSHSIEFVKNSYEYICQS